MEALGTAVTRVVLAEDGDLIVIVVNIEDPRNSKEFLVNSRTLSRSSDKWRALVSTMQDKTVLLTGNPRLHQLLLSIMHKGDGALPQRVSEEHLFELTLVAEEYRVTHLVGPMVTGWSPRPRDWLDSINYGPDTDGILARVQKRLWVAWIYGEGALFRHLTQLLVQAVTVGEEKELSFDGVSLSVVREAHKIPVIPGLYGFIADEYHKKYQGLCDVIHKATNVNDGQFCYLYSRPDEEQFTCDSTIVGSLIRGYQRHVLEPARKGEAKESLQTLFNQLNAIPIYNYPSEGILDKHGRTHDYCNPGPWIRMRLSYNYSGYLLLEESMEEHLRRQAQLTGVKEPESDTESDADMDNNEAEDLDDSGIAM
ncbi:hypothetical protein PG985_008076 [Apiospora marii]|uniref:uncharacterized protein n=1 Tax=Apiospora marii TaxID=335849 RepID=UPI00312E487A